MLTFNMNLENFIMVIRRLSLKLFAFYLVIGMILMSLELTSQTVIDIKIDKIYINNGDVIFYKKSGINEYACEIIPIKIYDHHFQLVLKSKISDLSLDDSLIVKEDEIQKFTSISKIDKWVKGLKFENEEKRVNNNYHSYLQYHSKNLFSLIGYRKSFSSCDRIVFDDANFWSFVYIRINNKYFIIGLVDEDGSLSGYIIPTKNVSIVTNEHKFYYPSANKIDSVGFLSNWDANKFYRIKDENDSAYLYDKLFNEKIIAQAFKNIRLSRNYIIGVTEKETFVIDTHLKMTKIKAACDSNYVTQFIIGNKLKWMDFNGKLHDTFTKPNLGVCGNIATTKRKIVFQDGAIKEIKVSENDLSFYYKESTQILNDKIVDSIKFLNNNTELSYNDYSNLFTVFSFPYSTYLIKTSNNSKLVSIINKNEAHKNELFSKKYYTKSQVEKDSLTILIDNFKDDVEIKTLFEGEIEAFGYNHPIRYKENNLYGYYPQNKKAKYIKLEKFNFFYAEFELPNGKRG